MIKMLRVTLIELSICIKLMARMMCAKQIVRCILDIMYSDRGGRAIDLRVRRQKTHRHFKASKQRKER